MEPVIKNYEGLSNPILGPDDGVPNYVMLYVQHPPGGTSPNHIHDWGASGVHHRGRGRALG